MRPFSAHYHHCPVFDEDTLPLLDEFPLYFNQNKYNFFIVFFSNIRHNIGQRSSYESKTLKNIILIHIKKNFDLNFYEFNEFMN